MKKQLLILTLGIATLLVACSPASIVTGSYTGDYSAYNWTSSNGSATATITNVNDNTVNVKISASGTDFNFDGVTVSKIEVPGVVLVQFSGSNAVASFDGSYSQAGGVNACSLQIDSTSSSGYIHFTGMK